MKVILEDAYDKLTNAQIGKACNDRFGNLINIDDQPNSVYMDIGTISSIAGLVVGLVSLCLQLRSHISTSSKKSLTDESDAAFFVTGEMKSMGIDANKSIIFRNCQNITDMNGEKCEIEVKDVHQDIRINFSLTETTFKLHKK